MLRIATSRAAPGMVLALPVLHPEKPQHLLLRPGVRLDSEILAKLKELRVPRLWISYPATSFLLQYASPVIMAEHGQLAGKLGEAFDAVTTHCHAEFDFHIFCDAVRSLVQRLLDDPHAAVFIEGIIDTRQPLLGHCANVCMISLLMGLKLDGYLIAERRNVNPRRAQNVENLGVGALLHDLGMLRIDPTAAERWYRNYDESEVAWRKHTLVGFEMVRGKVPATAAAVVLHHHQRLDGSGFPRRPRLWSAPRALLGSEIHIFARIVAIADVFDRVRQRREAAGIGGVSAAATVRALRTVLEQVRAGLLDANAFKALVSVVPAYPPGALVQLNNGQTCVVTKWNPTQPCSPTVRVLLPADPKTGEHSLGSSIDLAKNPSLSIRSVDGEDVSGDNFHPLYQGEFDLKLLNGGIRLDAPVPASEAA